jgi:CDP-diacylglycerol---glycerol-3-phosphate 3-phosphatidyltransferase
MYYDRRVMKQTARLGKRRSELTMDDWLRAQAVGIVHPMAEGLARLKLHPNTITLLGFALNVVAGLVVATGRLGLGAAIMLVASGTDALDGALARMTSQQSRFGAFLDSTLDRLSEGAVLLGLLTWWVQQREDVGALVVMMALMGSVMVSYTRARAEGVGYACKVGLLTRPIRVILLGLGLLSPWPLPILIALTALTWFTVAQRVAHVYRESVRNP